MTFAYWKQQHLGAWLQCAQGQQFVYGIQVLSMVKDVAPLISAPIILFIYYNPIKARGPEKLCQQAKAAGISGMQPF